jgi:hypothetical protein
MDEIEELAEKLEVGLHKPYDSVSVLCIYWESVQVGFRREAEEVTKLFSKDCNFKTQEYAIPLECSHFNLDKRINKFIEDENYQDPRTLLIIHYGGHADPNTHPPDHKDKRKLVFAE